MKGPILKFSQNQQVKVKQTNEELMLSKIDEMKSVINKDYTKLYDLIRRAEQSIFLQSELNTYPKLRKNFPGSISKTKELYDSMKEQIEIIKTTKSD